MTTLGITSMWVYRLRLGKDDLTRYGHSLQVYSERLCKWVHMAYFTPKEIAEADARYHETMRSQQCQEQHVHFSFNNMLEVSKINDRDHNPEITQMLIEITNILNVRLEKI